jgi:allantoate deiminase
MTHDAALAAKAGEAIRLCRQLAACSEEPGVTTRTFLSPPMRDVHAQLTDRMRKTGMTVDVDAAGNLRGRYPGTAQAGKPLLIGSHLDSVRDAGPFDGVLGVVLAVMLVELLDGRRLPFPVDVVGFSDEEGVRFGVPFIGSRALIGRVDDDLLERRDASGVTVRDAIAGFGLDSRRLPDARLTDSLGYVEFHIEQGPVLDSRGLPLGVVDGIVGQTRRRIVFSGAANHAGTTPMSGRRDALAAAAEWVVMVEREARHVPDLVATVGRAEILPGVANVIPGRVTASLDVRHLDDGIRTAAVDRMMADAAAAGAGRGVDVNVERLLDQPAVPMDDSLTTMMVRAVDAVGFPVHRMASGAGHDAMVLAARLPVAMLFIRSPGGISHHPNETVHEGDVAAALAVGLRFLEDLAEE